MSEHAPAFAGAVVITAAAVATHPEGAEVPDATTPADRPEPDEE